MKHDEFMSWQWWTWPDNYIMLLAPLTTRYHIITRYRHISNTIGDSTVCAVLINEVNTHLPTDLLTHLLINQSSKHFITNASYTNSSKPGKRNLSRRYLTRYLATYIYGQSSQLDYHLMNRKRRRSKQEEKYQICWNRKHKGGQLVSKTVFSRSVQYISCVQYVSCVSE